jgi:hypothetical protein
MEILFENRYKMTKERFMNWAKNPIKKNYLIVLWLILMIITIYMSITSIFNRDIFFSAFYLFLTMFCIYRGFFRTKILISKQFKVLAITQGVDRWERVIQFADCITVIDGITTTKYKWSQIVKLIDNKDYLILTLNNKLGLRIEKDGFTKGTPDSFLQFIISKYPSIHLSIEK